jgi:hypothetical protein
MSSNTNLQITDLDFSSIKNNFKTYLKSQDTFKDYNFEGSGLSVLLDVLAYNTQYNAYYLNMVGNEMFLDSALQRSSVISHAKLLNYTPKSATAPLAYINIAFNGVTSSSFTLPKFTNFMSETVGTSNYNFVTSDSHTVNTSDNVAAFENIIIKQGRPATFTFTVDSTTNPKFTFEIPDSNIDTTTIQILVKQSALSTSYDIYNLADNFLILNPESKVYFIQESLTGNYQIYFGDGILGKRLDDNNIVIVSYISTNGLASTGANNFTLMDNLGGYTSKTITPVIPATSGNAKESIDSIKYQAPKSFSSQNRAVTKDDYITVIQQNNLGLTFDAVNVWGGEENDVPVFGQVFICLKPAGSYNITETQKQRLIQDVIKPIGVMTVSPTIVDPDYTYLKLNINVVYDPNKTTQTAAQIESGVKTAIYSFANTTLNTFNSTFNSYELMKTIQDYSNSIITSEYDLKLQKKFFPSLVTPSTYNLYYNTSLDKGMFLSGVSSLPSVQFRDPANLVNIINGIYLEEVPASTNGVESISLINPGSQYQSSPIITILGDGTGAKAHAVLSGGSIKKIIIDAAGSGYTSAIVNITPQSSDTTGKLATGIVNLEGRFGTLRTYYNNTRQVKSVFNPNIGTIDYMNGIVTLNSFGPIGVDNPLGQFTVTVKPTTSIISSSHNRIITIDPYDANAVTVNVIAKS